MKTACWLLMTLALPLAGWGPKGHRLAASASLETLPPELRTWFADQEAALIQAALEPDLWKRDDPAEVGRHRIFCETYGGAARVPSPASLAREQVGAWAFEGSGQLPWVIQERFCQLVSAFKSGDRQRVVSASGWLCHYIADAQVPLHTTLNRDGKLTGQKGIHHRWEIDLLEQERGDIPGTHAAVVPSDVTNSVALWLIDSHALVPALLEADQTATRKAPGDKAAYLLAFASLQRETLQQQLRRSAERTGDLLLAAWAEAGRPRP